MKFGERVDLQAGISNGFRSVLPNRHNSATALHFGLVPAACEVEQSTRLVGSLIQTAVQPPSIGRVTPVTIVDALLER